MVHSKLKKDIIRFIEGQKEASLKEIYTELNLNSKPGRCLTRITLTRLCRHNLIERTQKKWTRNQKYRLTNTGYNQIERGYF